MLVHRAVLSIWPPARAARASVLVLALAWAAVPFHPHVACAGSDAECPPSWPRQLSDPAAIGPGAVRALISWPVGQGSDEGPPGLAVGGTFTIAGGQTVNRVAWLDEAAAIHPLGAGFNGPVSALAVLPMKGGALLVAGGEFTSAGGAPASRIAAWNGVTWSPMGLGFNGEVRALAMHDAGDGPALYAGGAFTIADGQPAAGIARWDGSSWSALGSGVVGTVHALASFDDGSGPALFVGGSFQTAGGVAASNVARHQNGNWSALGAGFNATVFAMARCELGGTHKLAIGGAFSKSGAQTTARVALWGESGFTYFPTGPGDVVYALAGAVVDGEPSLVAGGKFHLRVRRWNGSAWVAMGRLDNNEVLALHAATNLHGDTVHAGGSFNESGGRWVERLARWQDGAWRDLREREWGFWSDRLIHALEVLEGAEGPELLVAGSFDVAGGRSVGPLARFHGGRWSNAAPGLVGSIFGMHRSAIEPGVVWLAGTFEDGDGDPLTAIGLVRWERGSWQPAGALRRSVTQGSTFAPYARAVIEHDDGHGPAVWIGGIFQEVDGVSVASVARRGTDGWTSPGGGLNPLASSAGWAFEVFDDGSGPALFVGGDFSSAGDVSAKYLARWDGDSWSSVPVTASGDEAEGGVATGGTVWALRTHDDGSGPALYVGGFLESFDGWLGWGVHRFDGSSWTHLGLGTQGNVRQLVEWNSPEGMRLVAVGSIFLIPPNRKQVLEWDGTAWKGRVAPMSGHQLVEVWCAASLPDGSLAFGGWFRDFTAGGYVPGPGDALIRSRNLGILLASDLPWITEISDDIVLREGESLDLSARWARRDAGELPVVRWLRDGFIVQEEVAPTSELSSTLAIESVVLGDAGRYVLELENACGVVRSATVTVVVTCAADLDLDGVVDGRDLGALLAAWGDGGSGLDPAFDLDGDGMVGPADLSLLVAQWGACVG